MIKDLVSGSLRTLCRLNLILMEYSSRIASSKNVTNAELLK